MSLTPEQFEARKSGIGASEVAAVCGLSPYDKPIDIWAVKRGLIGPKEETEAMEIGSLMETVTAQLFALRTGGRVISVFEFAERLYAQGKITDAQRIEAQALGILRNPDTHPVFASCDRIAEFQNELVVCELKNVGFTNREKWGKIGEDKYPLEYLIQVQTQLHVTGLEVGFLCALIGGNDFRYYRIERDPDLWRMCLDRCRTFWSCVEGGFAPGPITESPAWKKIIAERFPDAARDKKAIEVLPDDDADMVEALAAVRAKKDAEKRIEIARNVLQERIGNGYKLRTTGLDATLIKSKGRSSTDWKAVAAELNIPADVIARHTTTGEPSVTVKLEDEE